MVVRMADEDEHKGKAVEERKEGTGVEARKEGKGLEARKEGTVAEAGKEGMDGLDARNAKDDELDSYAELWIQGDLDRWVWYENLKKKRKTMQERLKKSEQETEESLKELKTTLRDLQDITGYEFLKGDKEDFTTLSYVMFFVMLALPVAVAFWVSSGLARALSSISDPLMGGSL